MQHFKFVNWWILGFVFWCHEQDNRVNHSAAKTKLLKYRIRIFYKMPLLKNVWRLYINPERRSLRCAVIGKTGKTTVLPIFGGYISKIFSLSWPSITIGLVWLKLMMAPLNWVWRSPMQWTVTIEEANISVSSIYRCTIQGRKRNVKKASFHQWDTTFTILSNCNFF